MENDNKTVTLPSDGELLKIAEDVIEKYKGPLGELA